MLLALHVPTPKHSQESPSPLPAGSAAWPEASGCAVTWNGSVPTPQQKTKNDQLMTHVFCRKVFGFWFLSKKTYNFDTKIKIELAHGHPTKSLFSTKPRSFRSREHWQGSCSFCGMSLRWQAIRSNKKERTKSLFLLHSQRFQNRVSAKGTNVVSSNLSKRYLSVKCKYA